MLPKSFRPKQTYDLVRLGKVNDGGYTIEKASIENAQLLISLGIGAEWSFENHFSKLFPKKSIVCIDSVTSFRYLLVKTLRSFRQLVFPLPIRRMIDLQRYKINFYKFSNLLSAFFDYPSVKKHLHSIIVGLDGPSSRELSLQSILERFNADKPFFLKCDIEGGEYTILPDILRHQKMLTGLAIEFHRIQQYRKSIEEFIEHLDLELVHIHPNNARVDDNGDPHIIEMSFAKSPKALNSNMPSFPHPLDSSNVPYKKDIVLSFQ